MSNPFPPQPHMPQAPTHPKDRRWLWTICAVIVTSALWAIGAIATGYVGKASVNTDDPNPHADLRGYHTVDDLCTVANLSAVTGMGFSLPSTAYGQRNPTASTTKHPVSDRMICNVVFDVPGLKSTDSAHATLGIAVILNKQQDPGPEFAAAYQSEYKGDFGPTSPQPKIAKITSTGDDAFQTVYPNPTQTQRTSVQLQIREGWVVTQLTWMEELGGGEPGLLPSEADANAMLLKVAEATRTKLRT
ncbi:hypothetical protein [Nocardia sp. NPDC004722]